jgi:hypothetical protein
VKAVPSLEAEEPQLRDELIRRATAYAGTRRGAMLLGSIGGMAASAGLLLAQEQITPLSLVLGVASMAVLAWAAGRPGAKAVALVALDLALIFLYTWSLGQSMQVVVTGSPTRISVDINGNTHFSQPLGRFKSAAARGMWLGLYAGAPGTYVVGANGEFPPSSSWPASFATDLRFAVPRPGWNLKLSAGGTTGPVTAAELQPGIGNWSTNPRGEVEGTLGAIGWITKLHSPTFRLVGRLSRADGWQGIVFGFGSKKNGYLVTIRADHRDAQFYYWKNGPTMNCTCHYPVRDPVPTIPMIQRSLQFLLPSLILALFLFLVALGVYLIALPAGLAVARFGHRFRRPRSGGGTADPPAKSGRNSSALVSGTPWAAARAAPTTVSPPNSEDLRLGPISLRYVLDGGALTLGIAASVLAGLIAFNYNYTLPTIEDTATYLFQAKTFALGRLWAPVPHALSVNELMNFFALPFTVIFPQTVHGHWFGKYPPGWPLLLSVGAVFDKGWMVTPVVGGLTVLLIYLIGREVYGRAVGFLAAALALASPFVLSMSSSLLSQSATWLFCGLFVYLLILWTHRTQDLKTFALKVPTQHVVYLVGGGLAIGFAFATRQLDSLTVALPFLVLPARRPLAVLWIGAGAALPLGLLVLYNQAVTGNPTGSGYWLAEPWDRLGFGPGVGGPTQYEANFTVARSFWNFAYDLEHLQGGLFGWPFFFALALVAAPFLLGQARGWDWLFLGSTLCVMAAYMAYWASGVTGGLPRYWYVTVPWLILLAARGFEELYRWPRRLFTFLPSSALAALAFPTVLLGVLTAFDIAYYIPTNVLQYHNPGGAAVAAVHRAHLHKAIVFEVQSNRQNSAFDQVFSQNSPLLNSDVLWAIDRPGGSSNAPIIRAFPGRSYYRLTFRTNGTTVLRRISR